MITGVHLTTLRRVYKPETHTIDEIFNGELLVRNAKILTVKAGTVLGNHMHWFAEARLLISGCVDYEVVNKVTGERDAFRMTPGMIFYTTPHVVHTATFREDSVMLDLSEGAFVSREFNNIQY